MRITRELIIEKLKDTLELDPDVNALWLEGADGTGSTDTYSDLDFVLDVTDGKEKKILKKIHTALSKLSPFDLVSAVEQKNPKMLDQVLHLKNSSEYLLIDINIQSHSRKFKFSKEMKHETPVAIFDKKKIIDFHPFNHTAFEKEIAATLEEMKCRIAQYSRVKKYVHRKKFLEAMIYYQKFVLEPLVEVLRLKHLRYTHGLWLICISKHLPKEELRILENLYKVNSVEEILKKSKKAIQLFNTTLKSL